MADGPGSLRHLLFYPKPCFTSVFFATTFLLKFLVAPPHASQTDRKLAINHVTMAHQLFSPVKGGRDYQRAALLIEVLGRLIRSGELTHI